MRITASLALLLFALPVLAADDKPWPQKGDTVYVSLALSSSTPAMPLPGGMLQPRSVPVDVCMPLLVKKASGEADRFILETPIRLTMRLDGEWTPLFHRSKAECDDATAHQKAPQTISSGWLTKLVADPDSPHR